MAHLSLRLLGGFELRRESRALAVPAKKAQALLAYLALRTGRPHSREALTALLWGDVGERQARQSLRQAVLCLRRVFSAARSRGLVVQGEAVAIDPSAVDVDIAAFERLIRKGTLHALEAAVALYEGPLLDGFRLDEEPFEEWLRSERERLRELAVEALTKLLARQVRAGPAEAATRTAARLLALDPLQEGAHRTLMRLHVRQGRRAAALQQYQACVRLMQRELSVEPEAETKRLYQEILQRPARPAAATAGSPERGRASAKAARTGAASTETPLVGRDEAIAHWRGELREVRRGHGRVLFVTGEAGIGKTRLVEELIDEATRQGARAVVGRAYEAEQILPFRPWIDALRAAGALAHLEADLSRHPHWRTELARLFPEVAEDRVPPPITPANHQRLFETMDGLLGEFAFGQPLLVVLEDLHWADEMSLRLLSFVARRLAPRALALVATARDEELADAPILRRLLEELPTAFHVEHLRLGPLSVDDTTALVRAMARAGSNDALVLPLARQVWNISEGNPFVIVETMRTFHDESRAAPSVELPRRVRGMIAARLERLSSGAQRLAAVAAVIEREFSFALLQRAGGLSRRDTAEGVEELVRRRVLDAVGERFDFTHVRIRNAIYETLLAPRRMALHAAVGEAMEVVNAGRLDEVSDGLAYHFSRADEPARALNYLVRLGDKTARSYALEAATRTFRDALAHTHRLPSDARDHARLDVIYRLTHVLLLLGRSMEARDLLSAEEACIERLGDPSRSGLYYFWVAYVASSRGDPEGAIRNARRAFEESARGGDEGTMGKAGVVLAREVYILGRAREGIAQARQAAALLERKNEPSWLSQAHFALALNLLHLGDFTPALEALERSRVSAESIGDLRQQALGAMMAGNIYTLMREFEPGLTFCERAIELASDPVSRAIGRMFLGKLHGECGDPVQAIPILEAAMGELDELVRVGGYKPGQSEVLSAVALSEAYASTGKADHARTIAERALERGRAATYVVSVGYAERAMGVVARARGDLAEAEDYLARALVTFDSIETRLQTARTRLLLAEVRHARGDPDGASQHLRAAVDTLTRLRLPRWLEHSRAVAKDLGLSVEAGENVIARLPA